jgi:hypothetical protein
MNTRGIFVIGAGCYFSGANNSTMTEFSSLCMVEDFGRIKYKAKDLDEELKLHTVVLPYFIIEDKALQKLKDD